MTRLYKVILMSGGAFLSRGENLVETVEQRYELEPVDVLGCGAPRLVVTGRC